MHRKEELVVFLCYSTLSAPLKLVTVLSGRKSHFMHRSICIHFGKETKKGKKGTVATKYVYVERYA